jgi:hypothetical protein
MTPFQLDASAKAPCTSMIVGLAPVCVDMRLSFRCGLQADTGISIARRTAHRAREFAGRYPGLSLIAGMDEPARRSLRPPAAAA